MKRVRKFGPNAFKPKMPVAASRTKKFAEGGKVSPMPKRKLRPEEDPNYNPMDDLAPRGNLPSPEDNVTEGGPTQRNSPRRPSDKKRNPLPSDRATGYRSQVKETGMTPEERSDAVGKFAIGAASLLPAGRAARGLKTAKRRYDIGKRVDAMTEGQQKSAFLKAAREAKEIDGMKSGGSVQKYAKGGMVRGGGCETKGKTRGRFV